MKRIIISAPFGNWFESEFSTSTIGTYTYNNRAGLFRWRLLWKITTQIRYSRAKKGWINKLGLPNPGIHYLEKLVQRNGYRIDNKILSIHGFDYWEWYKLLSKAQKLKPLAIELNVSCPNVGDVPIHPALFKIAINTDIPIIVKLPPINYQDVFSMALRAGIKNFHCCNTFPTSRGGMSGIPLKPMVKNCIKDILSKEKDLDIIAGGGIRNIEDIKEYKKIGANKFAVATLFFNPRFLCPGYTNKILHSFEKEIN